MRAMLLAAGYGTRFRPVTFTLPKPLIPVCGRPLIAWPLESFLAQGVQDFVVNLHHFPDAIRDYLRRAFPQAHFEFSYEQEILGTGGGVRRVRALLEQDEEFFLANGDTIQTVPVEALLRARGNAIAALTLRRPPPDDRFTPVYFEDGRITGFGEGHGEALMFAGSHLISRRAFAHMPDKDVFGIVDQVYKPLLQRGETIAAVVDDAPWFDIGTPRRYLAASRALCGEDSAVWEGSNVTEGVTLESCIVAHGVELTRGSFRNLLICRDDPAIPRDFDAHFENGLVLRAI